MTETRKLAAVMFTDIAGYTALMSKDEHKALKILEKNRILQKSLAAKHNGEFLKEMGDGTLLCFQSALDAVRCAMAIQESVKDDADLNLRIGIHLGDIVFREGDVFGDGVNVASRIEKLAEAGRICASEEVYKSIRNQPGIEAVFLEEKHFKNVEHPVKVYAITHGDSAESRGDTKTGEKPQIKAIAVLPFVDMSQLKDQEYFCDGVAEEIINALTHVQDLRIIARTSAFSFKNKNMDVREIGRKLDVGFLLEGSVRKAGDALRVTAQMINVSDGSHIWSEKYDRNLDDVFAIQDEIAVKIVDSMKISLGKEERSLITKKYTENTEAYNLYLKGKSYWHQFNESGYKKGIEYFEKALEKDPQFALAHASIAACHVFLGWYYYTEPAEAFPAARKAAMNALKMDDDLAEAHSMLALVSMVFDREWKTAEQEFKKAIALNPGYAEAHLFYSFYLAARQRHEEAINEGKRGRALDPVTLFPGLNLGVRYYYARRYGESLETMKQAIDLNPHAAIAELYISLPLIMHRKYEEVYDRIQRAITEIGRDHSELLGALGVVEVFRGNHDSALNILEEFQKMSETGRVSCMFGCMLCTVLDKIDEAFIWLEKGLKSHDHLLIFLQVEPLLDRLRSDERYRDYLYRIGLG